MKRYLSLLMCLFLLVSMAVGCETASEPAAPAEKPAEAAALNTEKEFVIHFMTTPQWKGVYETTEPNADYPDFWKFVGEEFHKLHPNVTVDVQIVAGNERSAVLNTNLQAGTQPDIFYESMFPMTDYAHMGVLEPLDDLLSEEDLADISPAALAEGNLGGTQWFYPFASGIGLMVVNTDYFREAGLEDMLPAEGAVGNWTPEQFKDALAALKQNITKEGFSPFGLFCKSNQSDQYNNLYLRMYGAKMFNDEATACIINSEEGYKAAEFLKDIYDLGYTEPGPETYAGSDIRTMFKNQEIAVSYFMPGQYIQAVGEMESGQLEPFGMALFTLPSSGNPICFASNYGSCVFTNADPEQTAWAKEFVKFYSSGTEYPKAGINEGIPARASVAAQFSDRPHVQLFSSVTDYCISFSGGIPNYVPFRNLLYPTIQVILSGEKTPQKALDDLAADATKVIEEGIADSILY